MKTLTIAAALLCTAMTPALAEAKRDAKQSVQEGLDNADPRACFGETRGDIAKWMSEEGTPHGQAIRYRGASIPELDAWWTEEYCGEREPRR